MARNVSRHDRAVHGERDQRAPVGPKVGLSALSGKVRALLPAGASTFLIPGKKCPTPILCAGAGRRRPGFPSRQRSTSPACARPSLPVGGMGVRTQKCVKREGRWKILQPNTRVGGVSVSRAFSAQMLMENPASHSPLILDFPDHDHRAHCTVSINTIGIAPRCLVVHVPSHVRISLVLIF